MPQPSLAPTPDRSVAADLLRILALVAVVIAAIVLIGTTDAWWTLAVGVAALFVATIVIVLSIAAMLSDDGDRRSRAKSGGHSR